MSDGLRGFKVKLKWNGLIKWIKIVDKSYILNPLLTDHINQKSCNLCPASLNGVDSSSFKSWSLEVGWGQNKGKNCYVVTKACTFKTLKKGEKIVSKSLNKNLFTRNAAVCKEAFPVNGQLYLCLFKSCYPG